MKKTIGVIILNTLLMSVAGMWLVDNFGTMKIEKNTNDFSTYVDANYIVDVEGSGSFTGIACSLFEVEVDGNPVSATASEPTADSKCEKYVYTLNTTFEKSITFETTTETRIEVQSTNAVTTITITMRAGRQFVLGVIWAVIILMVNIGIWSINRW